MGASRQFTYLLHVGIHSGEANGESDGKNEQGHLTDANGSVSYFLVLWAFEVLRMCEEAAAATPGLFEIWVRHAGHQLFDK